MLNEVSSSNVALHHLPGHKVVICKEKARTGRQPSGITLTSVGLVESCAGAQGQLAKLTFAVLLSWPRVPCRV